jgi:hypothetical protein
MALQAQAQLLDELMGKYRNLGPGETVGQTKFDDDEVCKYYLCGICPHDLFVNTKADLGPCTKVHDDELRKQYEQSSRYSKCGYEDDYERFLRSLLNDVEKKIKRNQERLKLTQATDNSPEAMEKRTRLNDLREKVNAIIKQAETLGEMGEIEESQKTLESCEKYKAEIKILEMQVEANFGDQKQMEVCNVCGSFLIINDAQSRVEEHASGKQHSGYAKLRQALEDIRKKRADEFDKREKERSNNNGQYSNTQSRNYDRRDSKYYSSSSSSAAAPGRSSFRSSHRSSRSRSRSRSRHHHRNHHRNHHYDRSDSFSYHRQHKKHSRSRSRDSKRRSSAHHNNRDRSLVNTKDNTSSPIKQENYDQDIQQQQQSNQDSN